jgi:putative endonuclease
MTGSATAARKGALRNQALGDYGERLAERHLVAQGMVVLDRNWRCEAGEIDLVLRDGDVLVVCEVKTRTTVDYGTPHEAVGPGKLDRLVRLATRWQEAHGLAVPDVRIDLVAVLRAGRGAATIDHVRGIG